MICLFRMALCHAALAVSAMYTAHAAETVNTKRPTAAEASAPAAELKYDSAFSGYQPYRDQGLAPWRDLNNEVHRAGGHIGIVGGAAGKPAAQHPAGHPK